MQRLTITRRLEFDAGHRIPHHAGKCCHLHGHRYAIELTVSGPVHASICMAIDMRLSLLCLDRYMHRAVSLMMAW